MAGKAKEKHNETPANEQLDKRKKMIYNDQQMELSNPNQRGVT